ncbi:MAG: hypothetical protein DHS20C11_35370 [Lysobacteraceae bacterium]|nr:MAG: hypothetical protein DHS20C11_35370 [Xanthomonadaceae bacterium]
MLNGVAIQMMEQRKEAKLAWETFRREREPQSIERVHLELWWAAEPKYWLRSEASNVHDARVNAR